MSKPSTKWRDRLRLIPLYHVPRCCDDVEVMTYLAGLFLEFRSSHPEAHLNAVEVFQAARRKFGDYRCSTVLYHEH